MPLNQSGQTPDVYDYNQQQANVDILSTTVAAGGGATATLPTVGGSGPQTAAAVAKWAKVQIAGQTAWIPFWV
jgi:hypothetical protein